MVTDASPTTANGRRSNAELQTSISRFGSSARALTGPPYEAGRLVTVTQDATAVPSTKTAGSLRCTHRIVMRLAHDLCREVVVISPRRPCPLQPLEQRKALDSDDVPEVTLANIEATFSALYASRGEMFERGVIELFRSLSWDYKSNSPVRFGRKLVLRGAIDALAGRWEWARPNFSGCNSLDDLIRVMSILDGKPEPDHRNGAYPRLSAAGFPQCGEVDLGGYVKVRGYKNGNGHAFFMRPDLVDRMNAILARHHPDALPPSSTDR